MRQKNFILILIFLLMLLINLNFSVASCPVDISLGTLTLDINKPDLFVNFNSMDSAVTIISVYLNKSSKSYNLNYSSNDGNRTFNFTVVNSDYGDKIFLFNGEYDFTVEAEDKDGNKDKICVDVVIDAPEMPIWVSSPDNQFVSDKENIMGFSNQREFNLEIKTDSDAVCHLGPYRDNFDLNTITFVNLQKVLSTSPTKTHTLSINDDDQTDPKLNLQLSELKYDDFPEPYVVLCEIYDGITPKYFGKEIYVGYDLTPPESAEIDFSYSPEQIFDPSILITELNIDSYEDWLVCKYEFNSSMNTPQYNPTSANLFTEIKIPDDYKTSITNIFDFSNYGSNSFPPPGEELIYGTELVCYNLAGDEIIKDLNFSVYLNKTLTLTSSSPLLFSTPMQQFIFETNIFADVQYRITSVSDYYTYQDVDYTDGYVHEFETELEDGEYVLQIKASNNIDIITQSFNILVDTTPPSKPQFASSPYYCIRSTDFYQPLEVSIQYNDTDNSITKYVFTLEKKSQVINQTNKSSPFSELVSATYTFFNEVVLLTDKFTWNVFAEDVVGHKSLINSLPIQIFTANNPECDTTPPATYLNISTDETNPEKLNYNIVCEDTDGVCSKIYHLAVEQDEDCPSYQNYINLPEYASFNYDNDDPEIFSTEENIKVCFIVENKAGLRTGANQFVNAESIIEILAPATGISNKKNITLIITTNPLLPSTAICKHGYDSGAGNILTTYKNLFGSFNYLTTRPPPTYRDLIVTSTYPQFDYGQPAEISKPWIIICNDSGLFHMKRFTLGYDTSIPKITDVYMTKPIVEDLANPTTKIVVKVDDPVICTYDIFDDNSSLLFKSGLFDGYYEKNYKTTLEQELTFTLPDVGNYTTYVECFNEAGLDTNGSTTFKVKYTDAVGITILTPDTTRADGGLNVNATTVLLATCEYNLNSATNKTLSSTSTYSHNAKETSISEGLHTLNIYCLSDRGTTGAKGKKVLIDRTAPNLKIIAPDESCSLTKLKINFEVDLLNGSALDFINYTIKDSNNTLIKTGTLNDDGYQTITVSSLTKDKTYTITATAFDKAGNSKTASDTFKATEFNNLICDFTPPEGKIQLTDSIKGKLAEVSCIDNVGCSNTFNYGFGTNNTCEANDYKENTNLYYNGTSNPIVIKEPKLLCVEVFDLNGNEDNVSKKITLIAHCYNGIKDGTEENIDCGGECISCEFTQGVEGDYCTADNDCLGNLSCVQNKCKDTSSTPKKENGNSCNFNYECVSNFCNSGICEEKGDECSSNTDCGEGYECNYYNECVEITSNDEGTIYEEKSNLLAIILIILGLLMMGGGSYYVYYSKDKKQKEIQEQQLRQQQMMQQQTAEQRQKQQELQRKKIKELKERLKKQQELRQQKVDARKGARKSLLNAFDVDEEEKEKLQKQIEKEEDKLTRLDSEELARKAKYINQGKLDEGIDTEYVDLSEYHDLTDKDPFVHLKKLAGVDEEIKDKPIKKTNKNVETKPTNDTKNTTKSTSSKNSSNISRLAELNKNLNLKEFVKVFENKTLVEPKKPTQKKVDIDSFVDELFKNAMKNTPSKTQLKLDITTLSLLFNMLKDEGKLNDKTKKDIITKLISKNLINPEQANKL
ncbi:MAG: hypothetical protein AB7V77_03185 [Candidatus Woesearchaeota archaeon]